MTKFILPIMGSHFRPPAKVVLQALPAQHPLQLRPEPTNPYDQNAVAVWIDANTVPDDALEELRHTLPANGSNIEDFLEQRYWHLGYMPKAQAADHQEPIALLIEGHNVDATVSGIGFLWDGFPATLTFTSEGKPAISFQL